MNNGKMTLIHSPRCLEYHQPGHPESPRRITAMVEALKHHDFDWREPALCSEEDILRVHAPEQLAGVKTGNLHDADTPALKGIYDHARLAAGGAMLAADIALHGSPAFSLMRPPGHHAERNRVMGFCYFNNIAIAVAHLLNPSPKRAEDRVHRIAIVDFDCHHGNGTEDIFRGNESVLFVSLHQSPCYPNTGLKSHGNIKNYLLPPYTGEAEYLCAFDDALEGIAEFKPDALAVSAGFDTFHEDPITDMNLDIRTFGKIGASIAALKLPTFAVLEGGYSHQVGECVESFVLGWSGARV
jgi:acetoin utilization deacetylase AcuC-like enzyme